MDFIPDSIAYLGLEIESTPYTRQGEFDSIRLLGYLILYKKYRRGGGVSPALNTSTTNIYYSWLYRAPAALLCSHNVRIYTVRRRERRVYNQLGLD